jgi:signal transduction histidine kinase/ligand-binding sensor domain-containing protein
MTMVALTSPLFAGGPAAAAAAPPRPWTLDHFQHRGFTVNDGLPRDGATTIAQTADGLIWSSGDVRVAAFDGVQFRPFKPLPGEHVTDDEIYWMYAPSSGGLWIRYEKKGLDFIHDGHVSNFPFPPGDKEHTLGQLHEDRAGKVWALAGGVHFVGFDGTRWNRSAFADAPDEVRAIATDSHFNVWMVGDTHGQIYRRREGARAFEDMGVNVPDGYDISVTNDTALFVPSRSNGVSRFRIAGDKLAGCGAPLPGVASRMLADGYGGGWLPTVTDGVHYYASLEMLCPAPGAPASDVYSVGSKASGATSDIAVFGLVDREGNIWTTSGSTLDRYTRSAFSRVRVPHVITMTTIAADGSDIWIGSVASDAMRYSEGVAVPSSAAMGSIAMSTVPGGKGVIAASTSGVWALSPGKPHLIAPWPTGQAPAYPKSVFEDETGTLWLAVADNVHEYTNHAWQKAGDIGKSYAIYGNGQGTVWFALAAENSFSARSAAGVKTWTHADGVDVGVVKVVTKGPGGLWLAGERGVQLQGGNAFRTLQVKDGPAMEGVTGLVFDDSGSLWAHAKNGLYKVDARDIPRFVSGAATSAPATVLGDSDGLTGHASQTRSLPSLVRGNDGRLWLQVMQEVMWFDPRELPRHAAQSPPLITDLSVGERNFDLAPGAVSLPASERSPMIAYTAPATTDASKVRFQTRLAGFDDKWVDQGNRREVSYPRMAAGHYVFYVRASTDGASWTATPPHVAITVLPYFWETWWFRGGCVLAGLLVLWLLARWEVRRAVGRYRARLRIRADEREAIARDLHDTLLQSNLSLVLRLETIYQKAGEPHTRDSLHSLTESANRAVTESRKRLTALRDAEDDAGTLAARLEKLGRALGEEAGVTFSLDVQGKPRPLDLEASDELRLLLTEAITNACRHARADAVTVELRFERWQWSASVRDDGKGFPDGVLERPREGHWGVPGMRERAAKLQARFSIRPATPSGTEVSVVVPARRAYGRTGLWPLFNRNAA